MHHARFAAFGASMLAIATVLLAPLAAANFIQTRPYHQGANATGDAVCTTANGCTFPTPGHGTGDNNVVVSLSDSVLSQVSFEVTWVSGDPRHTVCHGSCFIDSSNIAEVTVRLYPAWLNEDSFVDCHLGSALACVPPTQGTITLHWFD